MPALPDVANVLRVDLQWQIGSDLAALTRLHIGYSGTAPVDTVCDTLAGDIYTIAAAEFIPYASGDVYLLGVVVTDLTSPTSGRGEHIQTTQGTNSANLIGAATALLASQKIARRYRGGKPRSYLPLGGDTDLATAQTWTNTFVTNVQAGLTAFMADVAATTASGTSLTTLKNVSYYQGFIVSTNPVTGRARNIPVLRTGGPVVDTVTDWLAEPRLSSQRRRNLRAT